MKLKIIINSSIQMQKRITVIESDKSKNFMLYLIVSIALFIASFPVAASSAEKTDSTAPTSSEKQEFENIITIGKPLKGKLQAVEANLERCTLKVYLKYDRTCGTKFDNSYVLKRIYVLNLKSYNIPEFFSSNNTINFVYDKNYKQKPEDYTSTDTMVLCTGDVITQNNPYFLIEGEREDVNQRLMLQSFKLQSYVNKYCR